MDAVFKALADPTRRHLLDELFRQEGQTLTELERRLPMTRFGVMKHLRILEEAGLVVTRRQGREKLHYLNAVPLRQVYERWVSRYAASWAGALSGLKREAEGPPPRRLFEIYVKAPPERVWEAIRQGRLGGEEASPGAWGVEAAGGLSRVTVTPEGGPLGEGGGAASAWMRVLSGLKTLLETGEPLS